MIIMHKIRIVCLSSGRKMQYMMFFRCHVFYVIEKKTDNKMDNEICNGKYQIVSKICSTDLAILYEGINKETSDKCLIKQFKFFDSDSPEIERELRIMKKAKSESLPLFRQDIRNENDGFYVVYSLINGDFLHTLIQKSSLKVLEARNIVILMYKVLKLLGQNNIALTKIPLETVIYSPTEPKVVFLDITYNREIGKDMDGALTEEMKAVKEFVEKMVPWFKDKDNIDEMWIRDEDKELLSFYNTLCEHPLQSGKHELVKGETKTVSLIDAIDMEADEYI